MSVTSNTIKGSPSRTPDWLATPIEFEEQRGFVVSRYRMRLVLVLVIGALGPPRHRDHDLSLNSASCICEALQLGEQVDKVRVLEITQRRPGAHQVDDLLRDGVR